MTQQTSDVFFRAEKAEMKPDPRKIGRSFAIPEHDDGAMNVPIDVGLANSHVLAMDGGTSSEAVLIERYRTMSIYTECDLAVSEIVDDAIVHDEIEPVVKLDLDGAEKLSVNVKKKIQANFDEILGMIDFDNRSSEYFRRWYVDSRIAFHAVLDAKQRSIVDIRLVDPRKLRKIRLIKNDVENGADVYSIADEFWIYSEAMSSLASMNEEQPFGVATYRSAERVPSGNGVIKISTDAIAYSGSGLVDATTGITYGYLQKAIKSFNQLRMLEDALVIYRLARAPERRIFYVDTGNLPPQKAEYYVRQLQNRYRSKIVYDAVTGKVTDQRKTMSMQDDFWLPRMAGSKGTEIDTLAGGENLGQIDDVLYFKEKLWRSLNVPASRFKSDSGAMMIGSQSAEISREELKFGKFVARLRNQFSNFLRDLLRLKLILENVIKPDEWDELNRSLKFAYAKDTDFAEARESELLARRLSIVAQADPFVGKYFGIKWVQKHALKFTDEEIQEQEEARDKDLALMNKLSMSSNPPPSGGNDYEGDGADDPNLE